MKKRRVEEMEVKVNVYQVASDIEKCIFQEMRGTNMKYKNRLSPIYSILNRIFISP